jgi:MFS family permease
VSALFIGAFSTAIYGLTYGFWPLFVGRLLWGLAWSGIWVGGNTIVLDIVKDNNRGRWVGLYQFSFFLGSATGSILGGVLTDLLGFNQTMIISASLTFFGALIALLFLPETWSLDQVPADASTDSQRLFASNPSKKLELFSITALFSINRLVIAGILMSTLSIFMHDQIGEQVQIAGYTIGITTLTGLGLGLSTLIAMFSAPLIGGFSDRVGNRWKVAAFGLVPGVVGFCLMALGLPLTILFGIPLIATTSGSNQGLSTALSGDLGKGQTQSRRLGILFTFGDFTSAIGPPLAFVLIPLTGIKTLYLLSAVLFAAMFLVTLLQETEQRK